MLSPEALAHRGLFEPAAVAQLVAAHRAHREDYTDALLALMNFEVWRASTGRRRHEDVAMELKAAMQ